MSCSSAARTMSSSSPSDEAEAASDADREGGDARLRRSRAARRGARRGSGAGRHEPDARMTVAASASALEALVRDRQCARAVGCLVGDAGLAADRAGGQPLGDRAERAVGRGGRGQRGGVERAEEGVEAAVDPVGARAGGLGRLAQRVADPAWELGIRVGEEGVVEAVAGVEGEQLEAGGDRRAVKAGEVGEQVRTRAEARLDVHLAVAGDGDADAHGVGGAAQALAQGVLHIRVIGTRADFRTPWPKPARDGRFAPEPPALRPKLPQPPAAPRRSSQRFMAGRFLAKTNL